MGTCTVAVAKLTLASPAHSCLTAKSCHGPWLKFSPSILLVGLDVYRILRGSPLGCASYRQSWKRWSPDSLSIFLLHREKSFGPRWEEIGPHAASLPRKTLNLLFHKPLSTAKFFWGGCLSVSVVEAIVFCTEKIISVCQRDSLWEWVFNLDFTAGVI